MTEGLASNSTIGAVPDGGRNRFATPTFVAAPLAVLWEA